MSTNEVGTPSQGAQFLPVTPATDEELAAWRPVALELAATGLSEERYCGALILRVEQEQARAELVQAGAAQWAAACLKSDKALAEAQAEVERLREEIETAWKEIEEGEYVWASARLAGILDAALQPPAPAEVPSHG